MTVAAAAVLMAVAFVLRMIYEDLPNAMLQSVMCLTRDSIHLFLLFMWVVSLHRRLTNKNVRRLMLLVGGLLLFWLVDQISSGLCFYIKGGRVILANSRMNALCHTIAGHALQDAVKSIQSRDPNARILLICDENSTPELARKVVPAKNDGLIDDFIYSSVSESYLTAMLESI